MGSAVAGGLGAGVGLFQTIKGAKQSRDAQNALENYQRQQLENVAEGLQVSTLGADLQREEQARLAATQVDALKGGGSRAIIGGLGRVEAGNQAVNRQIGADLDMQQKQIDQMRAEDERRIQGMIEQRQNQDISALSSQYNTGQQNMMSGFGNIIAGTGQAIVGTSKQAQPQQAQQPVQNQGTFQNPNMEFAPIYQPNIYNK